MSDLPSILHTMHCILQDLEMSTVAAAAYLRDGHLRLTGGGVAQLLPPGVLEAHQDSSVEDRGGACAEYVAHAIVGTSSGPSALEIAEAIQKHACLVSSDLLFKVTADLMIKYGACASRVSSFKRTHCCPILLAGWYAACFEAASGECT